MARNGLFVTHDIFHRKENAEDFFRVMFRYCLCYINVITQPSG